MNDLKYELKTLIIEECDKDFEQDDIADDLELLGGSLDIDSLDVLQICMALQLNYGVRVEGSTAARKVLKTINVLADYISSHRTK